MAIRCLKAIDHHILVVLLVISTAYIYIVNSLNLLCDPGIDWTLSDASFFHFDHTLCTVIVAGNTQNDLKATISVATIFSNYQNYPLNFTIRAIPFNVSTIDVGINVGISNGVSWSAKGDINAATTITNIWAAIDSETYEYWNGNHLSSVPMVSDTAASIVSMGFKVYPTAIGRVNGAIVDFASLNAINTLTPTTPSPTTVPSTMIPSINPSQHPTMIPSYIINPTLIPSYNPTLVPSHNPTLNPLQGPTVFTSTSIDSTYVETPVSDPFLSTSTIVPTPSPFGSKSVNDINSTQQFTEATTYIEPKDASFWLILLICIVSVGLLSCIIAGIMLYRRKTRSDIDAAHMSDVEMQGYVRGDDKQIEKEMKQNLERMDDDKPPGIVVRPEAVVRKDENVDDVTAGSTEGNNELMAVKDWLTNKVKLPQYYDILVENGYDSLSIIKEITKDEELKEIGVELKGHIIKLKKEAMKLHDFMIQ